MYQKIVCTNELKKFNKSEYFQFEQFISSVKLWILHVEWLKFWAKGIRNCN